MPEVQAASKMGLSVGDAAKGAVIGSLRGTAASPAA